MVLVEGGCKRSHRVGVPSLVQGMDRSPSSPTPLPRVPTHPGERGGGAKEHPFQVYSFTFVPTPRVGWLGVVSSTHHVPTITTVAHDHEVRRGCIETPPTGLATILVDAAVRTIEPTKPTQTHRDTGKPIHPSTDRHEDHERDEERMYTRFVPVSSPSTPLHLHVRGTRLDPRWFPNTKRDTLHQHDLSHPSASRSFTSIHASQGNVGNWTKPRATASTGGSRRHEWRRSTHQNRTVRT